MLSTVGPLIEILTPNRAFFAQHVPSRVSQKKADTYTRLSWHFGDAITYCISDYVPPLPPPTALVHTYMHINNRGRKTQLRGCQRPSVIYLLL